MFSVLLFYDCTFTREQSQSIHCVILICETENNTKAVESKTSITSRPSLGPLPKRQSYGQVYSQDAPQRSNPFKVNKEKTTTHTNGGFFENVEKEKQMLAEKNLKKSRKFRHESYHKFGNFSL